ncbi:MAG TPA: rod shape-determining protein MreD [Chitinophagaceae bacterium]|nr:rod shape-determining protein MreD [Chitinophagaceae bacterium]
MGSVIKYIVRFCLFILVQVFVLNQIPPLHRLITPDVYYLFILWLPFKTGRRPLMLVAFALGFALDSFTNTYGLHTAACLLIAYLRPFLINLLISQEGAESNYNEPSIKSMGFTPYFTYVAVLTFIHHSFLYFLWSLQLGGFFYFILKTVLSSVVSLFLILLTELLFVRKQRFKTNTA